MVGLPKKKHKEARDAERKRKHQGKPAGATEKKREEPAEERPYKPAPETDVLGWGHRDGSTS
ncbi:hypothetical protein [Streptomyces sp. NPDC046261]|uniref:hypothetical protein n=1 Tax=Streptomyces sp. NPDC046261 TaxID=3157200 RepID=UPI0033C85751